MIILRQKEFGIKNALGAGGTAFGLGAAIGIMANPGKIKDKLLTSLVLGAGMGAFGFLGGLITPDNIDMQEIKNNTPQPAPPSFSQEHQLSKHISKNKSEFEEVKKAVDSYFPEFEGISKILADRELWKLEPKCGDGDEYSCFSIIIGKDNKNLIKPRFIPVLAYSWQEPYIGINTWSGFWCTETETLKQINLRDFLVKKYTEELKFWEKFDEIEDEEKKEVLRWQEALISKVNRYL